MVSLRPLYALCDSRKFRHQVMTCCFHGFREIIKRKGGFAFPESGAIDVDIQDDLSKVVLILADVIHLSGYGIIILTVERHHLNQSIPIIVFEKLGQNQQGYYTGCIVNRSRRTLFCVDMG